MIRKAVIPAAGYGTRFLPATKSVPKEMLPVVDRPVIQYVVEEAVASGIHDILIVVSRAKRSIEEHFDRHPELEAVLEANGRTEDLKAIRDIASLARIQFVWQKTMSGLGAAILCAREYAGDEPFAVLLGDTLMESRVPVTHQLMEIQASSGESVVALEAVSPANVSRYGVIHGQALNDGLYRIDGLKEKPAPELAPSNLVIAGRYVLAPRVFDILERTPPGHGGEIQLTDALTILAQEHSLLGLRFEGRRHDLGNKLDWLKANMVFGLNRADTSAEFRRFLADLRYTTDEAQTD